MLKRWIIGLRLLWKLVSFTHLAGTLEMDEISDDLTVDPYFKDELPQIPALTYVGSKLDDDQRGEGTESRRIVHHGEQWKSSSRAMEMWRVLFRGSELST
ncbi:hypothetical protein M422DRAFT_248156 [Sphaerobolus stellatus SS14]|uniref:Uncharacterized protein n=1 Tax=Sphaerobolus stellatus (strain SS14) TaxID=990650 RepID=A0A0C9UWG5_SPHS4|nr:hypothetical protein M422DRAFT_248156 [Sphaerobolus stellatus SS14]